MTSFKRFKSKPVVKIIYTYTHCNLWRHRQFITIFYQFLHIRIEIIHGSHMYILFLPRVGLYVSFLPLANARGKTSWHKGLPVGKTIYTYGFHELFHNWPPSTSWRLCQRLYLTINKMLKLFTGFIHYSIWYSKLWAVAPPPLFPVRYRDEGKTILDFIESYNFILKITACWFPFANTLLWLYLTECVFKMILNIENLNIYFFLLQKKWREQQDIIHVHTNTITLPGIWAREINHQYVALLVR
jgi:hypothetical protein